MFGHDGLGNALTGKDRRLWDAQIGYWGRFVAGGNLNSAPHLAALPQLGDGLVP